MSDAPRFRVSDVALFERAVRLRMPFRFGVVTLTEAPQLYVRARIRLADGREAWGAGAELLVPKWFDKDLARTNEENFDQLRLAVRIARDAYLGDSAARSAFGHFAAHYRAELEACAVRGLNPLVASFGPAQIDRAILDALCNALGISFYDAVRADVPGIAFGELAPDLADFDVGAFLDTFVPADQIAARHTVGLVDAIAGHPHHVNDGLPESLEEVIAAYGHTWFKLKVGGDIDADLARLAEIARVLDASGAYRASLDGNEQYDDLDALQQLWARMNAEPGLARLVAAIEFIEQPINRRHALERDVSALSAIKPVIIDESDAEPEGFPAARKLGYRGVSSKMCKGLYKSLINAARCAHWNAGDAQGVRYFMTAEDLTTQAGLGVQQDLALVTLLGMTHVERNGHHYVNGMAGLPEAEQATFLAAHPDLYERSHGAVRLRIQAGELAIGSLRGAGFASGAYPDWNALVESPQPTLKAAA